MILLNPNDYNRYYPDEHSREIMLKTIAFFEQKQTVFISSIVSAQAKSH